ncbi:MAG: hypothetical protein K1W34_14000 [Lachnospiraceae bacterium]
MDLNKIAKDVFEKSHLCEKDYFETSVFFYLSGRYPDLTIKQAVDVVELLRDEMIDEEA